MQAAGSAEQKAQIRAQNRQMVEQRARELGVNAPFGKGADPATTQRLMMAQLLTEQERLQFRQQIQAATTEQERERIRNAHEETIRERAREFGVDLPSNFGRGPNSPN